MRDTGRRIAAVVLVVGVSVAGAPAPATAQTLRGTIVDAETGAPVTLAYVGLLAEGREMVVAALASPAGAFELAAPSVGSYFVYVSRSGYETLMDGVFDLGPDGVLDVRIGLEPSPVELAPLTVETNRSLNPLEAAGFYERAALGAGEYLIREEIERRVVARVADAFRGMPNLVVDESRPFTGSAEVMRSPSLLFVRGTGRCRPTLYVDGAMVATGVAGPVRPDDYVGPRDLDAIEVYQRDVDVPLQYAAVGDCGVVLLWTRKR